MKRKILCCIPILIFFMLSAKNKEELKTSPKEFLITQYGAVADGKTLNTQAIQKAIDEAFKNKRGQVIFLKADFCPEVL